MDLNTLYPASANSVATVTVGVLNADTVTFDVLDASVLPDAPNLLVLGTDQTAETVLMTAKDGNTLTVTRGVQGTAKEWVQGTQIARNFTAKDWNDIVANLSTAVNYVENMDASDVGARPDTWTPTASDVGAFPMDGGVAYSGDCNDLSDGMWRVAYDSTNTPDGNACIILHRTWDSNFKFQMAFSYTSFTIMYRWTVGGTWQDWTSKFLPLDGSVAMSGDLEINKSGATVNLVGDNARGARFRLASNGEIYLQARATDKTAYNALRVLPETNKLANLLRLEVYGVDGAGAYDVFGEHNKELLTEDEKAIPLADGYTSGYGSYYYKNADGDVVVRFQLHATEVKTKNVRHVIGTLPLGYRPSTFVFTPVANAGGGFVTGGSGTLIISTDGVMDVACENDWELIGATLTFKAHH